MDIICNMCGESWDSWGANHGDMAAWEYDLFKKGAGCPSCQGNGRKEEFLEERERSLISYENQDFYPLTGNYKGIWEMPETKVLWQCDH
jgi:hypothetical protein